MSAASAPGSGPSQPAAESSSASPSTGAPRPPSKLRSCVVCRSRKVRCDKQSPCSNCRRANIECVVPSNDRPPRWARRLERITNSTARDVAPSAASAAPGGASPATGQVMERLRNLEGLVKELSGQLEQAHAAAGSTAGGSSEGNSPARVRDTTPSSTGIQENLGRLVLQDKKQTQYISSGFWSRVSDELDGLKMDTRGLEGADSDTSDDDEDFQGKTPSSTQELYRAPSERHAFLFQHNLGPSAPDLGQFRPLPAEIPFLLDVFSENVNFILQVVHMPTITKMARDMRGSDRSNLSPANEALMFSIYYSAITSLEDEDVTTNFGSTKAELNLKYRLGFEHALARADFVHSPSLVLVQAFTLFLFLARRHDSPRFVWMMAGLAIRMAHAIGLHRDGSHFDHLSPYEVEMRRRVWWALCMLDTRASEDQGTEYTITAGTYDTELPLNINDADIDPDTREHPQERQALTDMTMALVSHEICGKARVMTGPEAKGSSPSPEERNRAIDALFENLERVYLRYATETDSIGVWVAVTATRLVMCKSTLFVFLPALFSSPGRGLPGEIRNKLLVAAIELAEYNHALNSEQRARHWRWMFQTYTHWHAVVYLLIECSRRPWSPILERAWVALHSSWLIPRQSDGMDRSSRIWVPLRKLMAQARRHRGAELARLRGNTQAVRQLEMADGGIPVPASSGPFPGGKSEELFLQRWRGLVGAPADTGGAGQAWSVGAGTSTSSSVAGSVSTPPQLSGTDTMGGQPWVVCNANLESGFLGGGSYVGGQDLCSAPGSSDFLVGMEPTGPTADKPTAPAGLPADPSMEAGFTGWLWGEADPMADVFGGTDLDMSMNVDGGVDWNNWVQSATGMEMSAWAAGNSSG